MGNKSSYFNRNPLNLEFRIWFMVGSSRSQIRTCGPTETCLIWNCLLCAGLHASLHYWQKILDFFVCNIELRQKTLSPIVIIWIVVDQTYLAHAVCVCVCTHTKLIVSGFSHWPSADIELLFCGPSWSL